MSKQVQRLKKEYPQLKEHSFFTIDNSVVVMKKDLPLFVGGEIRTIERYEKDGMERSKYSLSRLPLYDPVHSAIWKSKNKESKFRPNKQSSTIPPPTQKTENLDSFLETLPLYKREIFHLSELDPMDKLLKLRDTEKKETANRKELGELIDINDVDRAMSALAGVMMGSYIHYEDESSAELLHCKSATEIADKMREAHFEVFGELHEIINKEFGTGQGFYKIMSLVYQQLSKGTTVEQIKNRLENVK